MKKKYQVFISSTYADLKEERMAVTQCLLDNDCKFCSNGTPILKLAVHSFWFSGTRFLLKTVRFSFIIVM